MSFLIDSTFYLIHVYYIIKPLYILYVE